MSKHAVKQCWIFFVFLWKEVQQHHRMVLRSEAEADFLLAHKDYTFRQPVDN